MNCRAFRSSRLRAVRKKLQDLLLVEQAPEVRVRKVAARVLPPVQLQDQVQLDAEEPHDQDAPTSAGPCQELS